ncbi:hypothetical protein AVEN_71704-1 [Araneus ventricosus]|uniref:Uncharacterized protein n=1 Tax=Araneus ventricosus TaxID=182803 RepID=A0A4Y2SBC5_ARAVE|nr:hypothetical protein AVEN_71704-1 [Araneus ventricosus]
MMPVDSRQLENVKGELLKLTKKETAYFQLWQKVARTEEQINSLLTVMAQRGQKRRAEETEEQGNRRLSHMAQRGWREKQKNKEIADCQTWHDVARREEPKKSEEQRNGRLVRQDVSRDLKE